MRNSTLPGKPRISGQVQAEPGTLKRAGCLLPHPIHSRQLGLGPLASIMVLFSEAHHVGPPGKCAGTAGRTQTSVELRCGLLGKVCGHPALGSISYCADPPPQEGRQVWMQPHAARPAGWGLGVLLGFLLVPWSLSSSARPESTARAGCSSSWPRGKQQPLSLAEAVIFGIPGVLGRPVGSLVGQACVCLFSRKPLCSAPVKATSALRLGPELPVTSPWHCPGTRPRSDCCCGHGSSTQLCSLCPDWPRSVLPQEGWSQGAGPH